MIGLIEGLIKLGDSVYRLIVVNMTWVKSLVRTMLLYTF
jgi:hypothetical protein